MLNNFLSISSAVLFMLCRKTTTTKLRSPFTEHKGKKLETETHEMMCLNEFLIRSERLNFSCFRFPFLCVIFTEVEIKKKPEEMNVELEHKDFYGSVEENLRWKQNYMRKKNVEITHILIGSRSTFRSYSNFRISSSLSCFFRPSSPHRSHSRAHNDEKSCFLIQRTR